MRAKVKLFFFCTNILIENCIFFLQRKERYRTRMTRIEQIEADAILSLRAPTRNPPITSLGEWNADDADWAD